MKDKIQPGDLIIITIGALNLQKFVIYKVCEQVDMPGGIATRVITTSAQNLVLAVNDFEFIHPSNSVPNVGDEIIVINRDSPGVGRKYIVTQYDGGLDESIWIATGDSFVGWLRRTSYEIIRRSKAEYSGSCPDCGGTGKIVLLTSIVQCQRCASQRQT